MTSELTTHDTARLAESFVLRGDISGLSTQERAALYVRLCESLGLSAATQPFAALKLNGKEILYPTRGATDQLAAIHRLNRDIIDGPRLLEMGGVTLLYCKALVTHPNGRTETAIATLAGRVDENSLMKCETKAKRRATLSILGLGMLDETEIEAIPASAKAPSSLDTPAAATVTKADAKAAKEAATTAILADYDADVRDGRDPDEAWEAAKAKGRAQGCATEVQRRLALRERDAAEAKRAEAARIAALPPEEHPAAVSLSDDLASAETTAAVIQVVREHRDNLRANGVTPVGWPISVAAWDRVGGPQGAAGLRAALRSTPKATPPAPATEAVDAIVE